MFFLIPYGHEKQTVQRVPVITVILIAINLFVFLFTHYSKHSWEAVLRKHSELVEYVYTHAYLRLPADATQYFEKWQLEELESFREMHVMSDLDPTVVAGEQQRLEQIIAELQELESQNPFDRYGYIPAKPSPIKLITCLFIHSGWLHLLGNMFFLYLAGCSIEDLWGRPLYTGFYLVSGVVATLAHALMFPQGTEPLVGASGAIAGLMGAFMIRLYRTQINFFYMLGFWFRGTFRAPAFLMLPLWLFSQVFYAMVDPEGSSGVAFWAHIGGFAFGALGALAIQKWKIEERFIAPKIEQKVSLAQNPDFLRGMELSGRGNYPEALISLHQAVRAEPNHVDAYMEMRRIAQIEKNSELYRDATGSTLELLTRSHEDELVNEIYREYKSSQDARILPSRTLLALGMFYEDRGDFVEAEHLYRSVADYYPEDPLALKGLNKLSHLYFDRLRNPARGTEVFWEAYQHPRASEEWRSALELDRRKYGISDAPAPVRSTTVPPVTNPASPEVFDSPFPEQKDPVDDAPQAASSVSGEEALLRSGETQPVSYFDSRDAAAPVISADDRSGTGLEIAPVQLVKITLEGLNLLLPGGNPEFLPWRMIQQVSSAKIRIVGLTTTQPGEEFILLDLVIRSNSGVDPSIYRISSRDLSFDRIFPGVEQSFEEAFQNFVGIVLNNSRAKPIPNRSSCIGPQFASYPDVSRYEIRLKARLLDRNS